MRHRTFSVLDSEIARGERRPDRNVSHGGPDRNVRRATSGPQAIFCPPLFYQTLIPPSPQYLFIYNATPLKEKHLPIDILWIAIPTFHLSLRLVVAAHSMGQTVHY